MAISDYLAAKLLDHVLDNVPYTSPTTVYLSLWTVMPASDGTGGTEVIGGTYARQAVSVAASGSHQRYNDTLITFSGMPSCTLLGACLHDHISAGNLLYLASYPAPRAVLAGSDEQVLVGDIVFGLF